MATEDARLDEANLTAWPPGLFRFIHLLGAGAWIGFGVAIAQMVPDRWDPISIRALMAGLYVAVAIVSWTGRLAWRPLRRLALGVYVVTTFHAFVMVLMNDGHIAYALVLALNNLSISAGLDRPREQLAWGLYSTVGAAITWSLIPHSQTPIGFTVLALATFHSIFTGVYGRVWTALSSAHTEQALFTATFDSSGDALFLLTVGGDIARANAQAVALFRTTEAELLGRPYSVLVASTEPLRMRRDDGTTFSAEVVHETLPGDAGAVVRVSDVTQALQDRVLLQDALQRAEAAATTKGTFIATMSHEIRTPMTGVLGMLQLLEDDELTPAQQVRVAAAVRSAQSLRRILDEILEYSKLESGRMAVHPQPTDPRALVAELASLFAPQLEGKGLTMPVTVGPAVPAWVNVDPVRTRQVLMNLVGNAVKFTREGQVGLTVKARGPDTVALAVTDTGCGIDDASLATIFEPFVQADASNTRAHGGTGLGLAISRDLARLMGGDLVADSAVGAGSTFTLTVHAPACDAPRSGASAPLEPAAEPLRPDLRVLVAEDNIINRRVVEGLLKRLGVTPTLVHDGVEAVAAVEAERAWDLILMDVQMPNMDGLEATRRIRALHPNEHRIVALTASVAEAERQSCIDAGMDAVLAKPIEPAELSRVLQAVSSRAPY